MTYAFHPQIFSCPEIWALPVTEFKLYVALLTFCRPDGTGCFPKNETLAEMVGVKERSIQTALTSLEKLRIISRRIEHERNGVRGTWRSVQIHYVLGGRTTVSLGRDVSHDGAHLDSDGVHPDSGDGVRHKTGSAARQDAPQRNTPISEHSHITKGGGTREGVTESQSATVSAKLPGVLPPLSDTLITKINATFPNNPNAVLSKIRIAGWDEQRVTAALMKTDPARGVSYFTAICQRMTDTEVKETLAPPAESTAKPGIQSTPGRILSKDRTRISLDGGKTWVDVKTPMPNMPHWSQEPPPQLNWSSGNHKPPGRPLGGLLGGKVVEMTVEERAANGAGLAAREKEAAENRRLENEARQKAEADRAAMKDLMKRRNVRQNELVAQGKKLAEIGDILRKEGLAD